MIIGTAGHIDHGKTSLVKALTGIDTDRLAEEKRRGITIELGFAHLTLDDGTVAGVVDVPGHERFVKAMAAGAGGIDLAVMVIALDEGVMPQTREHLDICKLLGVQAGVVAVTKADLADNLGADWVEMIRADIVALVAGTFLENAPVILCSSRTGNGIQDLRRALGHVAKCAGQRPSDGPLFLPIDRAFSLKGFGTVVTGPLLSGQLAPDEQVSLLPGEPGPFRVRSVQRHGQTAARAVAGGRTAVNVSGIDPSRVHRGMTLTRAGELSPARMLDVELELLSAAESPLKKRQKLLLHVGTTQVEATVALVDREQLGPGEKGLAQLRLGEEIAALAGQRFILRGSKVLTGRGATLAGGRVLATSAKRRRRMNAAALAPLVSGKPDEQLRWLVQNTGYRGATLDELFARSALPQRVLSRAVETLSARKTLSLVDRDRRLYVATEVLTALELRALELIRAHHDRAPLSPGLGKEELRNRLSPELEAKVFNRITTTLIAAGEVEDAGELLRLKGQRVTLTQGDEEVRAGLVRALRSAGLGPPRVDELAKSLAVAKERLVAVLKLLATEGQICRIAEDLYFSKTAIDDLRERLVVYLREKQEISTQAFKEMVGESRKYVIPLSEYFDREKVTLRVGEKRMLRRG